MIAVRIAVFLVGLTLAGWTVLSAVRTVILPRSAQSVLTGVVFRVVRSPFRWLAGANRSFSWRDRVMALFAPVGLLTLVAAWLILTAAAFLLMFWAVQQQGWDEAFHVSGSSLLTLGTAPLLGAGPRLLGFVEAALGLALLALLITYLPSLYGAFSRRETLVALLAVRAGTPASAVEMLSRVHSIGQLESITGVWSAWEVWFAEIDESHTSFPALVFFRSPQPDRHWVTAAGTVLDSAALTLAAVDVPWQPQAALAIRSGFLTLRRVADFFGIEYDEDPAPTDAISITRAEFEDACERMAAQGVPIKPDRDRAWQDYAGWRVNYDTVLLDLAELTMAPYAPWTSDRSAPRHRRPRLRRWGRKQADLPG